MCAPDAPAPPDPKQTSAAQTGTSVATALANTFLQNVNKVGADGSSLTYSNSGSQKFTDPYTGVSYDIPQFTATEKLSGQAQKTFDAAQIAKGNLADAASAKTASLKNTLSQPWNADTSAIESRLFDLGSKALDPKFDRQRDDLETRLSNQGIKLGSDAYDRALGEMRETQNSAYSDLALRGRGQAFGELQSIRNQDLNETNALLTGSQVSMPSNSVNTPSGIATTDNAGLINSNYQQQLAAWQQKVAARNSLMGGLFGLGAAGIMGM